MALLFKAKIWRPCQKLLQLFILQLIIRPLFSGVYHLQESIWIMPQLGMHTTEVIPTVICTVGDNIFSVIICNLNSVPCLFSNLAFQQHKNKNGKFTGKIMYAIQVLLQLTSASTTQFSSFSSTCPPPAAAVTWSSESLFSCLHQSPWVQWWEAAITEHMITGLERSVKESSGSSTQYMFNTLSSSWEQLTWHNYN